MNDGGRVKSDETLFSIVEHLRSTDGAGVTELAERMDVAKSTVHKHLKTLEAHGFVVERGATYRLGLEFFKHGHDVRDRHEIYRAGRSKLDELAEETGEMASLLVPEGGRAMFLDARQGRTDISVESVIGTWNYMHSNSGGKAILARLPDAEVETIVDRHGLPEQTENTITERDELFDELERTRERGFALNLREDLEGIHAIGVPVIFEEAVIGAVSIAGPAHRVTVERCEEELAERLFAVRNDIELNLTYG